MEGQGPSFEAAAKRQQEIKNGLSLKKLENKPKEYDIMSLWCYRMEDKK